jgi:hypothetical protein
MMLGHPEAAVAEPLAGSREAAGIAEGGADVAAFGNWGEIEDRERDHRTYIGTHGRDCHPFSRAKGGRAQHVAKNGDQMKILPTLLILACAFPAAALAAEPGVQRLSDEQVERVLADAAAKREAAEIAALEPKPGIHGQAGVEVGTGGHRAAFGTAYIPLGSDGSGATVSIATSTGRDGLRRRRGR